MDEQKRIFEAAEHDIQLAFMDDDPCAICEHHIPCMGYDCPGYVYGQGVTDADGKYHPSFEWDCRDMKFGTCAILKDTICSGCDFKNHFKWRGPCVDNGGVQP